LQISARAASARGASRLFFEAGAFSLLFCAAGLRVVLLRVVWSLWRWPLPPDLTMLQLRLRRPRGVTCSPVPSAPLPPSAIRTIATIGAIGAIVTAAARRCGGFFTTRASRSISFSPRRRIQRQRLAQQRQRGGLLFGCAVTQRKARALQSLARTTSGISLPAVKSATSSSTAR
jgi:hypothetical protein